LSPSSSPTTLAPVTASPSKSPSNTPSKSPSKGPSASPTTLAPVTAAPITLAPITSAPVTASPTTAEPVESTNSPTASGTADGLEPEVPEGVITKAEFDFAGNAVSGAGRLLSESDYQIVLESSTSSADQFGVALTTSAYSGDVDFEISYVQDPNFTQTGYQSQLIAFLAEEDANAVDFTQTDGTFEASTVGWLKSKVWDSDPLGGMDVTYLYGTNGGSSTSPRYLEMSLRVQRLNNQIHTFYKVSDDWVEFGTPTTTTSIGPLKLGFRVWKEYKEFHKFTVTATKLSGDDASSGSSSPTAAGTPAETIDRLLV